MKPSVSLLIDPYPIYDQLGLDGSLSRIVEITKHDSLFLHALKDEIQDYDFTEVKPYAEIIVRKSKATRHDLSMSLEFMKQDTKLWGSVKDLLQGTLIRANLWRFAKQEEGSVAVSLTMLIQSRLVIVTII